MLLVSSGLRTSPSLLARSSRPSAASFALRVQNRANMASLAAFKVPEIKNEPITAYAKGSSERAKLVAALEALRSQAPLKVPIVVGGKEITAKTTTPQPIPSSHKDILAEASDASAEDISEAITSALAAKPAWENLPFADRAAIFLKAADLLAGKYRYEVNAATMLGQGKNALQAEIDAACELCDFLRFNVKYAQEMYAQQPTVNPQGIWNRLEYRPLEGFVYAVSPFNFTAIGGNLPASAALMGNVVLWKPSPSSIASNWLVYNIMLEAGLPRDVVQFVPGDPVQITKTVLEHPEFAALNFTGSTQVFRSIYGSIGRATAEGKYRNYPRIVGETGGKNFHLVHSSADVENVVINTVRGAFEYQGQKCSATSRAYIPKSLAEQIKTRLVEEIKKLKVGEPEKFDNFVGPVIHDRSFDKLSKVIDEAKNDSELKLLVGGTYDGSKGYYIHPTIYETTNADHKLMHNELFGPVLVLYVYDDAAPNAFADICAKVDKTSTYALTGAVFAQDRAALRFAEDALRNAAGNFYVNTKSTGSVVAQQPFGGARASGTNDKAGSPNVLTRFVSIRSVKEDFIGSNEVLYPSNFV